MTSKNIVSIVLYLIRESQILRINRILESNPNWYPNKYRLTPVFHLEAALMLVNVSIAITQFFS